MLAEAGAQAGTATMQGVHVSASSDWTTPVGNGSANSYSVTNWAVDDYSEFQVSTTGLVDIGLQFDHISSTTGPRDFNVQYSTNGTTFTDFSSYAVMPNAIPAWSSVGPVAPAGLDTFVFNLSSISAIENAANVYFRLTNSSTASANGVGTVPAGGTSRVDDVTIFNNFDPTQAPVQQPPTPSVLPQAGDIAFGLGSNRGKVTIGLLRGPASAAGGVSAGGATFSPWQSTPFVTNVRFDNLGGTAHNIR